MSKKIQISEAFKHLSKRLRLKINRELIIYLFFLLIAIIIWYLNALNKEYTSELKFKVRYTDLPEDKVLVSAPPDRLILMVTARGFTILKYRMGLIFYPVDLDASYRTLRKNRSSVHGEYYIATKSVFDKIAGELSSDVALKNISPDTLKFMFSEMIHKNVPVKVKAQLLFEKEFLPKGKMSIDPANVTVSGPRAIVDTMQYVYTRKGTFKRLNDTLRTKMSLEPVELLKYSVSRVSVEQPIERYTEASVSVPIEVINLPKGLTLKTFPGKVTVNCMVPMIDFEKLQPYMFRAVVDYSGIMDDASDNRAKAKVSLTKSPDFVAEVRFHPKNVDFIIEK